MQTKFAVVVVAVVTLAACTSTPPPDEPPARTPTPTASPVDASETPTPAGQKSPTTDADGQGLTVGALSPSGFADLPLGASREDMEQVLGPLTLADCPATETPAGGPFNITLWFDNDQRLAWIRVAQSFGQSTRLQPQSAGGVVEGDRAEEAAEAMRSAGLVVTVADGRLEAIGESDHVLTWSVADGQVLGVTARTPHAPADPTANCD